MGGADEAVTSPFSAEVGARLRAVRRAQRLSLDEVERKSGGRWSASAIGAYERGFRNLSLPRLRDLAEFYDVPMSALLGEGGEPEAPIVVDLCRLAEIDEAEPALRYLRKVVDQRECEAELDGVVRVRREDVKVLCAVLEIDEPQLFEKLNGWGCLAAGR